MIIKKYLKITLSVILIMANLLCQTSAIFALTTTAGQEMRTQVLFLADVIQDDGNMASLVTRAQLAKMLAKTSEYKDSVFDGGTTSVFQDVTKNHPYASYIKLCTEKGYMSGFLNGTFGPDKAITYSDLIRGALALLGYENADFAGDQIIGRYKMFTSLELDENIDNAKDVSSNVTKLEAVNVIYNLLKAKKKNSSNVYGTTVFKMTVNSDGELNASGLLKVNMQGPFIMKKGQTLYDVLPFAPESANYFVNGVAATFTTIQRELMDTGYVVLYYNVATRTVYAYRQGASLDSTVVVANGYVNHIYYNASDALTPNSVQIDMARYTLANSDVKFAFSYAGTVGIGSRVIFIYETTKDTESLDDDAASVGNLTSVFLYDIQY